KADQVHPPPACQEPARGRSRQHSRRWAGLDRRVASPSFTSHSIRWRARILTSALVTIDTFGATGSCNRPRPPPRAHGSFPPRVHLATMNVADQGRSPLSDSVMRAPSQPPAGRLHASMLAVRTFSIVGRMVVLTLFQSAAPAGEPAPSTNQHDPHDIRIALRCRQALGQDAELSRYAVCASVRQGVAVVWGRLPTEAMVQRALHVV